VTAWRRRSWPLRGIAATGSRTTGISGRTTSYQRQNHQRQWTAATSGRTTSVSGQDESKPLPQDAGTARKASWTGGAEKER
jgi:hypothetical protein